MAQQMVSQPWYSDVPRNTRTMTIAGVVIVATTVMGFGVWGNTAPIAGAVIATGLGLGFITYALCKLRAGRFAEAKPAVLVLAALFVAKFALG